MDGSVGHFFRINVVNLSAILDAEVYHHISPALSIDAGQFKAPFSGEFLIGAGSIKHHQLFINAQLNF